MLESLGEAEYKVVLPLLFEYVYTLLAPVHSITVTFPLLSIPLIPHTPNTLSQGGSGTASQLDRLTPEPLFTNVSLDIFGPWSIMKRHTRGGSA